jgi:hypothetical protein
MTATDWNTNATTSASYGSNHPTKFIAGSSNGFFTGLMTEWYHVNPYDGDESAVNYTDNSSGISSGWMCMDEWKPGYQWSGSWGSETQLLTYSSNPTQLQHYSSNGATEYSDAYQYTTGSLQEETSITLVPAAESNPLSGSDFFNVTYTLNSQPANASVHSGTLLLNADVGTDVVVSGVSADSSSTEEWALNSQSASTTITAGSTATLYYYDLLSQSVSYGIEGSGSISPTISYYSAPTTASSQSDPTSNSLPMLDSKQQTIWALRGTNASVSNNMLGPSQDQWATPLPTWTISTADQIYSNLLYYHQYQVTANYATQDNSVLSSAPLLSGIQFGSRYQLPLISTNQTAWLDQNTTWATTTVVSAPSGTEQWVCSTGNSGTITQTISISPSYSHQYYLNVTSVYGSTSGSGWYNSGAQAPFNVTATFPEDAGTRHVLSWNGSGSGSYSGSTVSNSVTVSNPITEAAGWTTQCYLNVNNGGHGTVTGSGWYNNGSIAQAIVSSNIVPGGEGTQYVFSGWTGGASGSGAISNTLTMNSPQTATATWTTQYQLTFTVTPSGSASISPSDTNMWVDSGPLSISAFPNLGYKFLQWTANTGSITFDNSNSASTNANINGSGMIMASLMSTPSPTPQPTPYPTAKPTQKPSPTPTASPANVTSPTESPLSMSNVQIYPSLVIFGALLVTFLFAVVVFAFKKSGKNSKP